MHRHIAGVVVLSLAVLFSACAEKKPAGPPPELLSRIQAAESEFQRVGPLGPGPSDTVKYAKLIGEAAKFKEAGDYAAAMDRARRAELEAVRLHGRLVYDRLMETSPSSSLTYNYRQSLKRSEDAEREGDLAGALNFARQALDQVSQLTVGQDECRKAAERDLEQIKKEIESAFQIPRKIELAYWDLIDELPRGNCDQINRMIVALKRDLEFFQSTNISVTPMFIVSAPPDYIKQFGDPWMYREVTPEGYLANRLIQLSPGTPVMFVRSMLFSRDKTHYFIRDTRTGREGWMAEERVWPDRRR